MGNNSVNNLHVHNYRQIEGTHPFVEGTRVSNMHMEVMKTLHGLFLYARVQISYVGLCFCWSLCYGEASFYFPG